MDTTEEGMLIQPFMIMKMMKMINMMKMMKTVALRRAIKETDDFLN